jgi:NAD(P)-dependent dehydrogenase (short-subunit alcohol dehydrogenase family)
MAEPTWQDMIDVNLTGVYHAAHAAIPHLIAGGRGGAMVLISSALGIRAMPNVSHYVAAKAGVIGLMRSLALELAPHRIRWRSPSQPVCTAPARAASTWSRSAGTVRSPDQL